MLKLILLYLILSMDESVESSGPQVTITPPEPNKKPILIITLVLVMLLVAVALLVVVVVRRQQTKVEEGVVTKPQVTQPAEPTQPPTFKGSFTDNFEEVDLNTNNWQGWISEGEPVIKQEGGKVVFEIPEDVGGPSSGILDSTLLVSGNFDASVDVELSVGGQNNETGFIFHEDVEGWPNCLAILFNKESDGSVFVRAISVRNGEASDLGSKYASAGPIKVQMIRAGNSVEFVVEGETIGKVEKYDFQGDGRLAFQVSSLEPDFPSVVSAFDNFSLTVR